MSYKHYSRVLNSIQKLNHESKRKHKLIKTNLQLTELFTILVWRVEAHFYYGEKNVELKN
jgi:hypothetical protein